MKSICIAINGDTDEEDDYRIEEQEAKLRQMKETKCNHEWTAVIRCELCGLIKPER